MKKFIPLLCLLFSIGGFAQTDVSAYVPGKNTDAVTYFLPKTAIEVEITTTKVKYTPGEFSKYADRYLRLNNISDKPDEYWEISDMKVTSTGIPDPSQGYSIKLKDKTVAPLVELTEEGIILSINKPAEKKTAAKADEASTSKKPRLNARDFMTEEILLASSSAKMAELVAKEIYNIRESKNAIIRGQADNMPQDGAAIKIMLSSLEEQEQAMMEMFTGVTETETRKFSLRMIPSKDVGEEVLFRFSRKLGVLDKDDLGGSPVYFTLTDLQTVPPVDENAKKNKVEGVVYNVPGNGQIKIFNNAKTFFEGSFAIAQFGNQEVLANNLFNKKNTTQVSFDPKTGGIVKIDRSE